MHTSTFTNVNFFLNNYTFPFSSCLLKLYIIENVQGVLKLISDFKPLECKFIRHI